MENSLEGCSCVNIPTLSSDSGCVYLFFEVDELLMKVSCVLEEIDIEHVCKDDMIEISINNQYAFFEQLLETERFDEVEEEAIRVAVAKEGEKLSFSMISKSISLSKAFNIIRAGEFYTVMQNSSFTVHFQPIIDVEHERIYAYEALLRGVRKDGSLIYPDDLFTQAKEDDLVFALDKMARENALKNASKHQIDRKLFINFIPTAIYDPEHCLKTTEEWASRLNITPKQIVFEVVETEQVKDIKHLQKILDYYRKKGYQTALDDVGSGYSSLNMFVQLETDYIKVDREIIMDIHQNSRKQSVYKSLYEAAKEHGVSVLAEGIETKDEFECIKSIGVDLAQGYYFAKPSAIPIKDADLKWEE